MKTGVKKSDCLSAIATLKSELVENVDSLFMQGGLSAPMKMLHDLNEELSTRLAGYNDDLDNGKEAVQLDYVAEAMCMSTAVMWKLAEMYETHAHLQNWQKLYDELS
jgi:hypothetical protein